MIGSVAVLSSSLTSTACIAEYSDHDQLESDHAAADQPASASGFQPVGPCQSEADYLPRSVIRFGFGSKPYTPPCVRLATGGFVVFQGSFAEHPLEPMPGGSEPSPIPPTRAGGELALELTDFGFYPYRCARHPDEVGVIWASWAF